MSNTSAKNKESLLAAIDRCEGIHDLFELVKSENIDIRMQTLGTASSIPPKDTDATSEENPLIKLKEMVSLAVINSD